MSTEKEFQEHLDEYNHEIFGNHNVYEELDLNHKFNIQNYEISDPRVSRDTSDLLFLLPAALVWVSVFFNDIVRLF